MKAHNCLHILLPLAFGCLLLAGCRHGDYTPKPYAYLRIDTPAHRYVPVDSLDGMALPFSFEQDAEARLTLKKATPRDVWVDLEYPRWDGVVFLSHKRLHGPDDLRGQLDTSSRLMENHYAVSSGIEEQGYDDEVHHVHGTVCYLRGNRVASTCQFWLTDSTSHFLRGALYLNHTPNNDSLAPVLDYIQADIEHLVETLRWR